MNPTWNSLTLLLTSTVLLLVTWMAATQRLAGVGSSDDPLLAMLVNFVGVLLALSGVLLFTVITVITDTVSRAWCTCHGVVLLFFTLMSGILLLLLAMSTWSLLYRGVRLESQVCGVRRAAALAAGMALGPTLLSAIVGEFEQRTLFCFMYKPPVAALILFEVPMLLLAVLSTFFSIWTAMIILLRRQSLTPPSLFPASFQTAEFVAKLDSDKTPSEPGVLSRRSQEAVSEADVTTQSKGKLSSSFNEDDEGEFRFLHAPDYEHAMHKALGKFQFQTKLVTMLVVLSLSGLVGIILEMIDSANWAGQHSDDGTYYQGQSASHVATVAKSSAVAATSGSGPSPASAAQAPAAVSAQSAANMNESFHESETGWAIVYLSMCGALVFALLATGPGLWEVRSHYW
ncbi:Hypothetical Protein FCC1311_009372 [Hondaea fermentalgiana]|uniref:Uncharacterized protein n=1 Tax=Hondaea fermentalgiana TaxID=2315210 RepID=A0A2R5G320_9STRA|nr:Hypothetical Protein FCC1311_009372 [Hondaea fermentalgiana]|eukprot:GBG24719.1 Hypothetical Protein FCC1311_009372 [Hondaea fermentalgiana]